MRKISIIGISILTLLMISAGQVYADEQLNKQEAIDLLSGNTVKAYYDYSVEGHVMKHTKDRVEIKYKFFSDGSAEKTAYPAGEAKNVVTEKGKWFFNEKEMLCTLWEVENKKRCGYLKRSSDGKIELHRKGLTLYFEKITPGT